MCIELLLSDINKGNPAGIANENFTSFYNLSDRKLNDIETNVLLMGLNFTPTPVKSNISEFDDNLNEFFQKIRLQVYLRAN